MFTQAAARTFAVEAPRQVQSRDALRNLGVTPSEVKARVAAGRWRLCGHAVVLHNGPLTRRQRWDAALINVGPRAMLTAFTAAERGGLTGWDRDQVHVLAPMGTAPVRLPGLEVIVHRTRRWTLAAAPGVFRCQAMPSALVMAAVTFASPRPACAILAAGVQQRLVSAGDLHVQLVRRATVRHRRLMLAAVADIAGGSEALSELDFVRLCRKHGLPEPIRQQVRQERSGRRRYLDATWRRKDGRLVVAEVDGALHLSPARWWEDQHRQNELALADALVLRFPSVVIRTQPTLVAAQLRRALGG